MAVVQKRLGCEHDMSEFYNLLRVVNMAKSTGLAGGVSLDLTVPASDGYIWDFCRKHCRDMAMQIVDEQKPVFPMHSPECTPYSNIHNFNLRTPQGKENV